MLQSNPFSHCTVVKSMRRSANLKDFTYAINKKVLGTEEEADDESEF